MQQAEAGNESGSTRERGHIGGKGERGRQKRQTRCSVAKCHSLCLCTVPALTSIPASVAPPVVSAAAAAVATSGSAYSPLLPLLLLAALRRLLV